MVQGTAEMSSWHKCACPRIIPGYQSMQSHYFGPLIASPTLWSKNSGTFLVPNPLRNGHTSFSKASIPTFESSTLKLIQTADACGTCHTGPDIRYPSCRDTLRLEREQRQAGLLCSEFEMVTGVLGEQLHRKLDFRKHSQSAFNTCPATRKPLV
jgi:hypothetical protein